MEIEAIKPEISKIAQKYNLDLVVLFGSQATGRSNNTSDIDVAVFGKDTFDIYRLGSELDLLLKRQDVHVVDLNQTSPTLMYMVVKEGVLLYESYATAFLLWKVYAMRVWMQTAWLRKLGEKKLLRWSHQL